MQPPKKQHLIALNQKQLEFLYADLLGALSDSGTYSTEEILVVASILKKLKNRLDSENV